MTGEEETRIALQALVGKTVASTSITRQSGEEYDRDFDIIEITTADGTITRFATADAEGWSSWLDVHQPSEETP